MAALPRVDLTPGDVVDERTALTLAGALAERTTAGGATVAAGSDGAVVIAEPGDGPAVSCVWSLRHFVLRGSLPELVSRSLDGGPVPLFVRLDAGCLYLGTGEIESHGFGDGIPRRDLRMTPPLRRDLLDRARPPAPLGALPGLEWLALLPGRRTAALELFVTEWFPPPASDTLGADAQADSLPPTLARVHELAEGTPALRSLRDRVLAPEGLYGGMDDLILYAEDFRGGCLWSPYSSLPRPEDDPEVWSLDGRHDAPAALEALSGHLLQFALFEAMVRAPYAAHHGPRHGPYLWDVNPPGRPLRSQDVAAVTAALRPVPLRPWWPSNSAGFHVGPGVIAHVTSRRDGAHVLWIGAAHRDLLRPFGELGIDWARFDG